MSARTSRTDPANAGRSECATSATPIRAPTSGMSRVAAPPIAPSAPSRTNPPIAAFSRDRGDRGRGTNSRSTVTAAPARISVTRTDWSPRGRPKTRVTARCRPSARRREATLASTKSDCSCASVATTRGWQAALTMSSPDTDDRAHSATPAAPTSGAARLPAGDALLVFVLRAGDGLALSAVSWAEMLNGAYSRDDDEERVREFVSARLSARRRQARP
jgi:hypothetical protein